MSPIFRRSAHDDAQAASSSKNRKRPSTDDPATTSIQPLTTHAEEKKSSLLPNPKDLLHRSKPGGSPASQHTAASRRGDPQDGSRTPRSERRGSSSSRPSVFRAFDDPPSPRSESASLSGDKAKGRGDTDDQDLAGETDSIRSAIRAQGLQPLTKQVEGQGPASASAPTGPSPTDATSSTYPGVVLGAFGGPQESNSLGFGVDAIGFDGSINDILDPSAAPVDHDRQGSSSGPAAPNIAPWLTDDSPPTPTPPRTPLGENTPDTPPARDLPRKQSISALNHFGSVSSLSKAKRTNTQETANEGSRQKDTSSYFPATAALTGISDASGKAPSRAGSTESVQTLLAKRPPADEHVHHHTGGVRGPSGSRSKHAGSIASTSSGAAGDKKKGFLGALLKRRTGQSMSQTVATETSPTDTQHHRGSTTSRLSNSSSQISPGTQPSTRDSSPMHIDLPKHNGHFEQDTPISPMYELGEPEFTLDMNLDDMEGIVDTSIAHAPPSSTQTTSTRLPSIQSTSSGRPGTGSASGSGSIFAGDAAPGHNSSISTTASDSSSSPGPGGGASISSDGKTSDPFTRVNPFQASPRASFSAKVRTPPSPNTLVLSPRYSITSSMPRRPSQLRNVNIGSFDSEASSSDTPDSAPPTWASGPTAGMTLFSDPFGSQTRDVPELEESISPSLPGFPSPQAKLHSVHKDGPSPGSVPAIASAIGGAAWAAPESWGVEGEGEQDTSSSSSSEEDEWVASEGEEGVNALPSPTDPAAEVLSSSPGASIRKPPPFGHKSANKQSGDIARSSNRKGRSRNASGRPGTAVRPSAGTRTGTSGTIHTSTLPHYIRIYRADESYSILAFPITATTTDIISFLSGAGDTSSSRRITTHMRLYIRERGQDRQLHPSERPLMIQDRRLRQAGYTEAEKIEELGKDDLVLFCKFIYQVPHLPVMNPEEESSYDSFEFIDIGHRGLLTIPIFLHLHAHNIIILNISRNPMTDIPLDFVQACVNLKELRMSYMTLKRIPTSICASTTLSRLDVSCNRIADLESVPLHEIHTLLSLKVQNNKLTTIPSYFAQMKSLKYLNISNNKFEHFPNVVCEMSNLVDLDVSFNNIAELPSEMSNLKSLERLAAFGNELRTFPASFATLANLRALDVRRNKLTNLTSVYALPNLSTLQADYNNLVTLDAQLGSKVRQFSVPHNSITRFTLAPQLNMSGVSYALTHLNLSHGKISILADEALEGLVNLVDLNLNFNQFTRIPPIGTLKNLEILSVTDNLLEMLPLGVGKLQKLRILNVHNNNLKGISTELWACGSLEHLNASSNLVAALPNPPTVEEMAEVVGMERAREMYAQGIPSFPISKSLRRLHLADNSCSDDILSWLALATDLVVLNLSFNDIYEIPSGVLSKWSKLEQLYLSGNQITTLPSEDLEKMRNLKVLHLNGNKMQTLPSELGALTSLQHLDVGSNVLKYNIANWPYDWNWNWNTELRYLNLSGNKRLEIKPSSAQEMQHAAPGFRKDLSDFTALKKLRVLGLMDVTLRIPSVPDESDEKRVRTSFSDINNMRYGISDMIGSNEYLAMFDLVVPNFRGKDNECLFGMFGRSSSQTPAGKIPRFLQQHFASSLSDQLDRLGEAEDVLTALRRTFLFSNREAFRYLQQAAEANARKASIASFASTESNPRTWSLGSSSQLNTGASGAVVYLVDKTLHVANVGDCLVILSRKGEAELLSKYFDPTDREETARIRRAEAWVSTKGYVNDEKDVDISRAVGFYQHFPAVNASPEIKTRPLSESDEFVIIGNHALWKCCSYQTAVDIARTERDDPMMAAQKLRDFAISYGAEGSVMVMVVNVSDLFYGRGPRSRGGAAGPGPVELASDPARDKRNIRRRYETFGDRTLNRLQQEIEPPQGQVAIVFTDIVNSTYLWETNPGMPTAIKIHHNLMRRQLRMDGGYEVKTEGDSFMVSFQTVTSALLWAFNCQIGLLQQEWPREMLQAEDGKVVYDSEGNLVQRGLRVRMGVHWGSPQCERDPITRRMDYYGPMVNRAARINASADGGQLMASQDVINEIQALREYIDTLDESEIPSEMKREIVELKRIDFDVKDMGERKLKGLEVPERLHLLYPKSLAGRFETSNDLRANVEVADPRSLVAPRQIDIEEVRELAKVVLRLEHLCSAHQFASLAVPPNQPLATLTGPTPSPMLRSSSQQQQQQHKDATLITPSKRHVHPRTRHHPPAFLGPHIRDDMSDDELLVVIESLTTRTENAMSTLYFKHFGGFGSALAALEQATKIDPRLLVHAMSLMHGALEQPPPL